MDRTTGRITVEPPPVRRILIAELAVVTVVTTIAYGLLELLRPTPAAPRCHGLLQFGAECVGSLVEEAGSLFGTSDQAVRQVLQSIIAENVRVAKSGKPYVRIGLLMPMTAAEGSAFTPAEIRDSLRGAYTAQIEANSDLPTDLGDPAPWFQLVLANQGADESAWHQTVDSLVPMTTGPHALVAVTGLGISKPAAASAAKRLGDLNVPTIGSVLTADDMVSGGWLFKVNPSNREFAAALGKRVRALATPPAKGYLVWDRNPGSYVRTLHEALDAEFGRTYNLESHNQAFTGSRLPAAAEPQPFAPVVQEICAADPDIVFFSGSSRDLPKFLEALARPDRCSIKSRPIWVATTSIGLTVNPMKLRGARMRILDAAGADDASWQRGVEGTPGRYPAFVRRFTALGFPATDLSSGYAVMHRDALAAAVWAARRAVVVKGTVGKMTGADVRDMLFSSQSVPVPGAAGPFYFRETTPPNGLWPQGRRIPVIQFGDS